MRRVMHDCDCCGAKGVKVSVIPFVTGITPDPSGHGKAQEDIEKRDECQECVRNAFVELVKAMPHDQQVELCKQMSKARKA